MYLIPERINLNQHFYRLLVINVCKPMSNVNDTTNHLKYIFNHEYLFVTYKYIIYDSYKMYFKETFIIKLYFNLDVGIRYLIYWLVKSIWFLLSIMMYNSYFNRLEFNL